MACLPATTVAGDVVGFPEPWSSTLPPLPRAQSGCRQNRRQTPGVAEQAVAA